MKIVDLIALLQNRLATLNSARTSAMATGEVGRVFEIDADIAETEDTLAKLKSQS